MTADGKKRVPHFDPPDKKEKRNLPTAKKRTGDDTTSARDAALADVSPRRQNDALENKRRKTPSSP